MITKGTRNTSGDGTAVAEADPAVNRLVVGPFVQLQNKGAVDVNVKLKFGSTEIYDALLPAGVGVIPGLPKELRVSAANAALYVNLSAAVAVYYQIVYRLV